MALCAKPRPIAIIIGICCADFASNSFNCGSICAYSLASASGAVSFVIVSVNCLRSSSVTGSLFISLLQSAFILANSGGGSVISNNAAILFSRIAFTEAVMVPSGELVAMATAAGVVGADEFC